MPGGGGGVPPRGGVPTGCGWVGRPRVWGRRSGAGRPCVGVFECEFSPPEFSPEFCLATIQFLLRSFFYAMCDMCASRKDRDPFFTLCATCARQERIACRTQRKKRLATCAKNRLINNSGRVVMLRVSIACDAHEE